MQYAWLGFALGFLTVRKVADMSGLSLSDDPFASVAEEAGRSRRAFSLIFLFLFPVLGLSGMAFAPKTHLPAGSLSRVADYDDMPDLSTRIANQLHEIELAHWKVIYWMRRTTQPGVVTAADRAKLVAWERSEKHRRALLAHMSRN